MAKPRDLPVDEFICSFKSPLRPYSVSGPVSDARGDRNEQDKDVILCCASGKGK